MCGCRVVRRGLRVGLDDEGGTFRQARPVEAYLDALRRGVAASDWPKRIRDMQYIDVDDSDCGV